MRSSLQAGLVALGLLGAVAPGPACAEDPAPAPAPPARYADRDADWWVGELREPTTRVIAVGALRKIGPPAVPALLHAWERVDDRQRQAILAVLRDIESLPPELGKALPRMLDERASEAQSLGLLELVRRIGPAPGALTLIARLGESGSPRVRQAAAAALQNLPLRTLLLSGTFERLLEANEALLVVRTLEALARGGPEARDAIPLVDELLLRPAQRDPRVLAAAFKTLSALRPQAPFDAPTFVRLLEAHAEGTDPSSLIRLASNQHATPEVLRTLLRCLAHPTPEVRKATTDTLGTLQLKPDLLAPELLALLGEDDPDLALALLRMLHRLGPDAAPAAGHIAAQLLSPNDPGPDVVLEAIATLRACRSASDAVLDAAAHIAATSTDREAIAAVGLLGEQGVDERPVADRLLRVAEVGRGAVREAALQALSARRRPLPEEAPALRRLLEMPDEAAHVHVAGLLAKVGSRDAQLLDLVERLLAQRIEEPNLRAAYLRLAPEHADRALELELTMDPRLRPTWLEAFAKQPRVLAREPRASQAIVAFDRWLREGATQGMLEPIARLLSSTGLAPQEPEALEVLGRWLDHTSSALASFAAQALAASPAGVAQRFKLLASRDVAVRRVAIRGLALGQPRELPPGGLEALATALRDADEDVRATTAVWLATQAPPPFATHNPAELPEGAAQAWARAALDALRRGRSNEVVVAVNVYVRMGIALPQALPLLRGLLDDDTNSLPPGLLAHALALTSERADAGVLETLRADLENADLVRRADALLVFALWHIESDRVLALLPELLDHPSGRVALRALAACEALGPAARELAPALERRIERGEASALLGEACRALVAVAPGPDGALVALRRWWLDPGRGWRVSVLPRVLAGLGEPGAQLLVDGLDDPDLREASLKSLGGMGGQARAVLPRLRELQSSRPQDTLLRTTVERLSAR